MRRVKESMGIGCGMTKICTNVGLGGEKGPVYSNFYTKRVVTQNVSYRAVGKSLRSDIGCVVRPK